MAGLVPGLVPAIHALAAARKTWMRRVPQTSLRSLRKLDCVPAHDVDSETSSGLRDASGGSSIHVDVLDLDVKAVADVTAVSVAARQQRAGLIR
jgi:hypothetical protein